MIEFAEQAIAAINDTDLAENERTAAIHYLRDNPSDKGNAALIATLEDDDHGLRYAASGALGPHRRASDPGAAGRIGKPRQQ